MNPMKAANRLFPSPKARPCAESSSIRPTWIKTQFHSSARLSLSLGGDRRGAENFGRKTGRSRTTGFFWSTSIRLNGGPTLPTMSCGIQMLRPGETTGSHRHTSSTVYHVFRGAGATVIDDVRYEWESGDSFTVPLWQFHHHENRLAQPAILFVLSNKPGAKRSRLLSRGRGKGMTAQPHSHGRKEIRLYES